MKKKKALAIVIISVCLCLTACKSSDYKSAIELEEAGDYQAAVEIFEQLTDYKDTNDHLAVCKDMIKAIDAFNTAAAGLTAKNDELNKAITEAEELINSQDKALDETLRPSLETAVSDAKAEIIEVPEMPATADEINATADTITGADYSKASKALNKATKALSDSIKKYELVNNPSEAYVIKCLKKVPGVLDISAATEKNDPNGKLGKAGGYTAAIYFSHKNVNQSEVYGNSVIDKGTDCGGQIEVYETEEFANKRNDYLASFDGGIFSNGSHTVIGTVVVRTSEEMTASQQKKVEAEIIEALTALK